ncbi:hypothetical protein C8F04DRAFT_1177432 [Mycena alexandri]|uniref:mitogen-activated protein kinase kinase kinase n=1 Tax=Mycena alexandri TaxID=1745969 RepID=A0AAD6T9A1_9AGAR|nr:hypothetical protein C8F04DRAFT_1177432 [Mycena alexandri]
MSCDNAVNGIVASPGHRRMLLELSSKLGLYNDPGFRSALRADEERLAALIVSILDSKPAQDAVLKLEGDSAQFFVDVIQEALNRGFLMAQDHSRRARRIIRKLSESSDKLPSSLFISGVTGREEHPSFAGGFGDIYRASYGGKTVALKHMRHIQSAELRDIRLRLCREALVWKDLRHPYILTFIGIDRDSIPSSLCMVSPWMEQGTILNYLKDHGRSNADKFLSEIAQGLQYLHSRKIVHGDLRGANILINEDWSACLADFGLSVFANTTTSMYTSTRAGSIYWMAPELIDPDRFGYRYARTPSSDVYAFGCVCFELYTGHPPFSELSQAAALLRVVNGERPGRPSTSPALSLALWQHVTAYWAEDAATRPSIDVVVQEMAWPSPRRNRKSSRSLPSIPLAQSMPSPIPVTRPPPLPPIPLARPTPLPPIPIVRPTPLPPIPASPSASPSLSSPSSPPVYFTPKGSPPGYNAGDYQRVELSPSKMAQMEKASEQGPSRELDLGHIMKLLDKASERSMRDQTVVLSGGMKTLVERARQRDLAKQQALAEQLAHYSDAGRLHSQDAALQHTRKNPDTLLYLPEFIQEVVPRPGDPEEILTLPDFLNDLEVLPVPHALDDPFLAAPPPSEERRLTHRRKPSLPWLRISPSRSTRLYQLSNSKSSPSIPESIVNAKASSPLIFRHSSASALRKQVRGPSAQIGLDENKTPIRERVKDALAAATLTTGSNTALRGLWRRAKPQSTDSQAVAESSRSSFSVGCLSEREDESDEDEAADADSHEKTPPAGPDSRRLLADNKKSASGSPQRIVPPDEDTWRLFECKNAAGDATQLSEILAMTPSFGLNNSTITELYQKCVESQQSIFSQIPWASAGAERSRVIQQRESTTGNERLAAPAFTWEEGLLLEMLAANEALVGAIRLHDELARAAVQRDEEKSASHQDTPDSGDSSSRARARPRHPPPKSKRSRLPATEPPSLPPQENLPQPPTSSEGSAGSNLLEAPGPASGDSELDKHPHKAKALKDFIADPSDVDEISFSAGEILDILDKQGKWWLAQKADGSIGIASSDYFGTPDEVNLESRSNRSSPRVLPVHPYGTSEHGRSFSQEEIFDLVDKQLQSWKTRKPDRDSIPSSDYSSLSGSEPETFQHKAQAHFAFSADASDPREISFDQGEVLEIGEMGANWWRARNTSGTVGIVPSNYLSVI